MEATECHFILIVEWQPVLFIVNYRALDKQNSIW